MILGPAADAARLSQSSTASEALRTIADERRAFVSRGDDSGTHKKEQELWQAARIAPEGDWYLKAGAGMAQVLRMANEKEAYTLADRATYLALQKELGLVVVLEGDPRLLNRYSVIVIQPEKHPHLATEAARSFADYLVSPSGQELIGEYGVARFGRPLFTPDATPAAR